MVTSPHVDMPSVGGLLTTCAVLAFSQMFPFLPPGQLLRGHLCLRTSHERRLADSLCQPPPRHGCLRSEGVGGQGGQLPVPTSDRCPPAVDAEGNTVVWLVAANLTDELQDGVNGRGDIVVWPVFIVELVDGADFLQEEMSSGRVRGQLLQLLRAQTGMLAQQGEAVVLWMSPVPVCIGKQRLEGQRAAVLAPKAALPLYDILDVTCWPHSPRV